MYVYSYACIYIDLYVSIQIYIRPPMLTRRGAGGRVSGFNIDKSQVRLRGVPAQAVLVSTREYLRVPVSPIECH
jgi:hypothetical protein